MQKVEEAIEFFKEHFQLKSQWLYELMAKFISLFLNNKHIYERNEKGLIEREL